MVCAPVRRDYPRALARGLSIVQAHKPCSFSLFTIISGVDLAHYGVSRAKDCNYHFNVILSSIFRFRHTDVIRCCHQRSRGFIAALLAVFYLNKVCQHSNVVVVRHFPSSEVSLE